MSRVLIFVRHGVRGFQSPPAPTVPLQPQPLLLAYKEDLNLFGHLHSHALGQWIKKKYGQPDFLYGDVTYPRTVDTSVSIGYGAGLKEIFLSAQGTDTYFNPPLLQTVETIQATQDLLTAYEEALQKIKATIESVKGAPKLQDSSSYNIGQNVVTGLQPQAYTIGALMFLGQYSQIDSPYLRHREEIAPIVPINWNLTYPTASSVQAAARTFLGGIRRCLRKHCLSVLVGHEHNAITLARYLQKAFQVPGFPKCWIPRTPASFSLWTEIAYRLRSCTCGQMGNSSVCPTSV